MGSEQHKIALKDNYEYVGSFKSESEPIPHGNGLLMLNGSQVFKGKFEEGKALEGNFSLNSKELSY